MRLVLTNSHNFFTRIKMSLYGSCHFFVCLGDSVVLQTAIPVDPALQVLQATPTPTGGIYTTPVGPAVVNYNPVPVGSALSAPPPQPAQDWYKDQKLTSAYIQSE